MQNWCLIQFKTAHDCILKSRILCSQNGAEVGLLGTPGRLINAGCNALAEAASWAVVERPPGNGH